MKSISRKWISNAFLPTTTTSTSDDKKRPAMDGEECWDLILNGFVIKVVFSPKDNRRHLAKDVSFRETLFYGERIMLNG
jgi:hypothetical protein